MGGLYTPLPVVTAPCTWLSLFGSLVGLGLRWAPLPHPLSTHSPCPTLKPSSLSQCQGQSSLLGCAQPSVCAQQLVCKGVGVISPPSPRIPVLLPPAHPDTPSAGTALAACMGLLEPACPPFPAVGSVGSPPPPTPCPHHPFLTLLLSLQALGAGCWRAAAGAPRQAPSPLHGQLHQHQVRGAGPWDAVVTATGRDRAVVGMGRGGLCSLVSHCVHLPGSVVGPALTFRIRQNPQNLSLADVANQAGELGRGPAGPALLFAPPLPPPKLCATSQGPGRGVSHHTSQCPWLNWGAGVGWTAVGGIRWLGLLGGLLGGGEAAP